MKGMVVTPQPRAAEVGIEVLRAGGNAVDAAVAAAFVQGVTDPLNCGIGGLGWMTVYMAGPREDTYLDFCARVGSLAKADMWVDDVLGASPDGGGYILRGDVNELGYQSIGVPGAVAGLHEALSRWGTLDWEQVLRPAISLAREGYVVPRELADEWRVVYPEGRPDALARFTNTPDSAAIYTKDGKTLSGGDLLVNADLADSLEAIATGGSGVFYRGEIASRLVGDWEANGGSITAEDLAGYRPKAQQPLRDMYRGYGVSTVPAPAGGPTLISVLNVLEGYDLASMGHNSAEYLRVLSQALKAGFADRARHVGDPAFVDVPTDMLVSKEHAASWRDRIDSDEPFEVGFDRSGRNGGTTHVSVVDDLRNCVSLTHTNGLCSGVVTPGLGFLQNNYMIAFDPMPGGPNSIAPGKMRITGSSPCLLFRDGEPFMVLGAPGGTFIIGAVLQTILNVVEFGMTALEAVSAPRIDCQGDLVYLEGRIPQSVCGELAGMGLTVWRDSASYGAYPTSAARVHAIVLDGPAGGIKGGADPRGYGVALSL